MQFADPIIFAISDLRICVLRTQFFADLKLTSALSNFVHRKFMENLSYDSKNTRTIQQFLLYVAQIVLFEIGNILLENNEKYE